MHAPLPDPLRCPPLDRPRMRAAAVAVIAVIALWPATARAFTVQVPEPFIRGGHLYVATTLQDPFDAGVVQSLQGGMPVTVTVRAELWRRRSGWFGFGGQEASSPAVMRIGYETLRDRYRVQRSGEPLRYYDSLDSLTAYLTRPWIIPLASLGSLRAGAVHYVIVHATLKPLTLEDAAAVEGWLAGEQDAGGSGGFGMLAGLPRALFEAARGVAGFGDREARAASRNFYTPAAPGSDPRR